DVPNNNPSGAGAFDFPLRFPGQYFDRETLTHYNYSRDCYDPVTGRYCESDPIGLRGGINTYLYVKADPLGRTDSLGLRSMSFPCMPANSLDLQALTAYYAATQGIPSSPDPQNMCTDAGCRGMNQYLESIMLLGSAMAVPVGVEGAVGVACSVPVRTW